MKSKDWRVYPRKKDNLIEQILLNRGLKKTEDIKNFFNPDLKNYQKELNIPQIEKSIKRIKQAIEKQELVIVYGDYDVDGVCASAILYKALTSIGAKVLPYIPHREKEGYGLSNTGLDFCRDSGAQVIITVDNGIVALDQARYAKSLGLDMIITDHHLPAAALPDAFSIVHSIKMCGAGVAWCLIKDDVKPSLSKELLQFVAIATVADMMPLLSVNRAFLVEGLKVLNNTDNIGLKSLILNSGLEPGQIGSYEIGHVLGPRINAIGRLEHAIDALRLLCTKDQIKAVRLSKLLSDTNTQRQILTAKAVDEARIRVTQDKKIYVFESNDWSSGIIGLIAGRITEETNRPSIAISVGEKKSKGSARSIQGINIVEIIRQASSLLIDIGGHSGAAGFSIETHLIEEFKIKLEKIMQKIDIPGEKVLNIDAVLESNDLNKDLVGQLEKFAPFGFGNPSIVLASKNMHFSDLRTLSEGKHLKLKADGIDAIGFGMGEMEEQVKEGKSLDLAYNLEINKFRGNETLQLKIKDLKVN